MNIQRDTYVAGDWADQWIKIRWLEFLAPSPEGDVYKPGVTGIINKRSVLGKAYVALSADKAYVVTPSERFFYLFVCY